MRKDEDISLGLIIVILTVFIALFALASKPSSNAIEKCMDTTNYSKERCVHEIMR